MLINSVIALSLALCKAAAATIIFRPNSANRQSALIGPSLPSITDPEDPNKVPGHNNVNYGPVPEAEQLFKLEYLEIAPTPIPVDQIFFAFLRGGIPSYREKEIPDLEEQLRTATINIIVSVVEDDGYSEQTLNSTVPFAPIALANNAHLSIRNEEGTYVQHLVPGYNEVLTDYWIPSRWLATGTWTWKIVARLGNGDCLFAFTLTQRLEGAW